MKPRAGAVHCRGGAEEDPSRGSAKHLRTPPLALAAAGAKASEEVTKEAAGKAC